MAAALTSRSLGRVAAAVNVSGPSSFTLQPFHTVCRQCRTRQPTYHLSRRARFHSSRLLNAQTSSSSMPPNSKERSALEEEIDTLLKQPLKQTASQESTMVGENEKSGNKPTDVAPKKAQSSLADLIDSYLSPSNALIGATTSKTQRKPEPMSLDPAPFRLGVVAGRTIKIDPRKGVDVARAMNKLQLVCNQNQVRSEVSKQRFHERPGLKRKRLKSVRWRRRFKAGFQAMVSRTYEMKRMGW